MALDKQIPEIGQTVYWNWYGKVIHGQVIEISYQKTFIESKGKLITRNGTKENPAIIISHKNGNNVIKLASELTNKKRADFFCTF